MDISTESMAPISSPYSSNPMVSSHDCEISDLKSVSSLVDSINKYIRELLANAETRSSLKLRCTSKVEYQKQELCEFAGLSVLANFYWGIDSIEAAIQTSSKEESAERLRNSEQMLQVPALLDEEEFTAGIPNRYLVCWSYFYLSVVRNLQQDGWQAALHFFQALLVSPGLFRTEIAPELWENLFPSCSVHDKKETIGRRSFASIHLTESVRDEYTEAMRQMARRCKDWLTYHQVMLYGDTPQRLCGRRVSSSADNDSECHTRSKPASIESSNSIDRGHSRQSCHNYEKVHPLDPQDVTYEMTEKPRPAFEGPKLEDHRKASRTSNQLSKFQVQNGAIERNSSIRCLRDLLMESESEDSSDEDSDTEIKVDKNDKKCAMRTPPTNAGVTWAEIFDQKQQASCSASNPELYSQIPVPVSFAVLKDRDEESNPLRNHCVMNEATQRKLGPDKFQLFPHIASSTSPQKCRTTLTDHQGSAAKNLQNSGSWRNFNRVCSRSQKDSTTELLAILEKTISKLCLTGSGKSDEEYAVEVTKIYKMLNSKTGAKYSMLKDVILDQLLSGISPSQEARVIRTSMSILTTIISANKSVIEDIKTKGLQLRDLASALKQNVHEAAVLIYLIKPSPVEIKTLEILPALVEVVCSADIHKARTTSLLLTPSGASVMIIEVLVTAFDDTTNSKHLAAINSPGVLLRLLDVSGTSNLDEFMSLATILVKCMQFDGQCRKYISQFTPVAPFIFLLQSNEKRAKFIALEYFHEVLRIPRSYAINLLQKIQKEGSTTLMHKLMDCIQHLQPEYQLLAANLLLQLDAMDNSSGRRIFTEEAMKILLEYLAFEESSEVQLLSALIISNLGGTYSWTGEPYTTAWLVKKAGLTSPWHRNIIRNFNWSDKSLQDPLTDSWCSRMGRSIINTGNPLFCALEKGLKSKTRRVARACLTAIAWLGFEITKSPNSLRYSACDILLSGIEQFLHPGLELEDRLLACLCIYNYSSGKGMQKLTCSSEGVRESLRRLSSVIWMAEELHKVTDYYLPDKTKQRISCVHTQILEVGLKRSGAVCALIYYKGLLYSGHSDGSVKVWDIRGQSAILLWDMKEHKKAVTCFSLFEPGDSLLSGSDDKTIRVWQTLQRKPECIEVIPMKEPIQHIDAYGKMIFVLTASHHLKVLDESKTVSDICRSKKVKCMRVVQDKIYAGCTDSSIQGFSITKNREQEIKAPAKGWKRQRRPINSIVAYKDWLYCGSGTVEASNLMEWRRLGKPQMSIAIEKGDTVLEMGVVEDFIYLNSSSSANNIQIWLRGTQQKLGRISAGSRIKSLLTANDMLLCGTESGMIKGWIPL